MLFLYCAYWIASTVDPSIHYSDVIMGAMVSQITSLAIVYSTVYSGADHRKHQSSTSLAFVRGIHRPPVNSPHKGPVTRKIFPFDDVIRIFLSALTWNPSHWDTDINYNKSSVKLNHVENLGLRQCQILFVSLIMKSTSKSYVYLRNKTTMKDL